MPDALTNDWTDLVEQWNAEDPRPIRDHVRARIEAGRRRLVWSVVADVAITLLCISLALFALFRFPGGWSTLLSVNVGAMVLLTWAFAMWNRRGTWRPLGETTEMYLRLARLRCQRTLQAVHFGMGVVVAQVLFVLAWRLLGPRDAPFERTTLVILAPVGVVVVFVVALVSTRRRALRELAALEALQAIDET